MKRFICILCVIIVAFSLFGCVKKPVETTPLEDMDLSGIDFSGQNLNNCIDSTTEFQTDGETYFYTAYNGLDSTLNVYYGGQHAVLVDQAEWEEDILDYQYYINGNTLYFSTYLEEYADDGEWESTKYSFYAYDLTAKSYSLLGAVSDVYRWTMAGEYIIYLVSNDSQYGMSALHRYDPADGTDTCIASEIEDFGIVNGKVRYISYDGSYKVIDHDPTTQESAEIGSFEGYSIKEYVSYNFTSNSIVMLPWDTNENRDDTQISVYNVAEDSTAVYSIPVSAYQLIACEQYAYLDGYTPDDENCAYRVDLTNGQWEKLDVPLDETTNIYAVSDELLYTVKYTSALVMLGKTEITRYDLESGTSTLVFSY